MQVMYEQRKVAALENKIVLNDNFYASIPLDFNSPASRRYRDYPYKLSSMTAILLCLEGSIAVQVNLKKYLLSKNDIVINLPGQIGEFNGMSRDAQFAIIAFSNDFYYPVIRITTLTTQQDFLYNKPYCHFSDKDMEESLAIYKFIKNKITENDGYCNEESIKAYLHALTFNIYYKHLSEENNNRIYRISRQREIFDRFMEAVKKHYTRERSIKFYADLLCITPKYLSQVVYKINGRYAGEYIHDHIILEAKVLIRSRSYSIQQISEMLHFTSPSFFGRYFKKATGYTPLQYQDKD
jgi:YesN/AraC family two-component response regulator